jgi:hypothetical protein
MPKEKFNKSVGIDSVLKNYEIGDKAARLEIVRQILTSVGHSR